MIKRSKLKELVECIVKQTLDETGLSLASTGDSSVSPVSPVNAMLDKANGMSAAEQEKMRRLQKQQAQRDLKVQKKEYDQAKAKEKSLEKDYKVTRRVTVPSMKKSLDAKRLQITTM